MSPRSLPAIICSIFYLSSLSARAQVFPDLEFSQLSEKNGLSADNATSIAQDQDGFIWIATTDGLNRFDGYQVRKFFHRPHDSGSLLHNSIGRITPDGSGNIWLTTAAGLCYYDKMQNRFAGFGRTGKNGDRTAPDRFFGCIVDTATNQVWASGYGALYHSSGNGSLQKETLFLMDRSDRGDRKTARLPHNAILYEDRIHRFWAYDSSMLFLLGPEKKSIIESYVLPGFEIVSFYQDRRGNYWVGSYWGGVYRFNPISHAFTRLRLNTTGAIIYSITAWKDKADKDWIVLGTKRGITLVDPLTLASKDYLPRPFDELSLIGNQVRCVFTDRQQILWIATDKGVSYVEPSRQIISSRTVYVPHNSLEKRNNNPIDPGFIYSCIRDSNYYYATNWEDDGLFRFTEDGPLERIVPDLCPNLPDSLRIYTKRAMDFKRAPDGTWWFTTDLGMVHFDFKIHRSVLYAAPMASSNIAPAGLRTIVPINDSLWWIRTRNNGPNGIYIFNVRQKNYVVHYYNKPGCTACLPPRLGDLIASRNGHIYTCPSDHYIYTYDAARDNFVPLIDERHPLSFPSATFNCLVEDTAGNLWIGTPNGLISFDPIGRRILRDYSSDKTLGEVDISRICLDDEQNVWMATERGLFCLVPGSGEIYHFDTGDGLPTNSYPGMLVRGIDHELLAGGAGYLVHFRPAALLHHRVSAEVHFSDATIMDAPATWKQGKNDRRMLTLSPGQNIFSVDYAVLNYDQPGRNRYYYKLDGVNDQWKENENGHLSFYNLPPGRYTLHVKGEDRFGQSFSGEASMDIVVTPAWWQTLWFMVAGIGLLICLSAWLVGRRIAYIRHEATVRQKIAETEMMALRAQMNPHFIFNSMNSIENFITQNERRLASDYLNKFARLIRIILDSSRSPFVHLVSDMEALQLYVDLEQMRFNNKFTYRASIEPSLLDEDFHVPPLLIQPFVENAIVHGLAHSDKRGLQLQVSAERDREYIRYTVEDNGIGRKRAGAYNEQYKAGHQSVGLLITQERINIFNRQHHSGGDIRIFDLFDDQDRPAGTRVIIKIKPT